MSSRAMSVPAARETTIPRTHRGQVIELITAAEARGQGRLVEMNQQVLDNLNRIIGTLDDDAPARAEASDAG